MSTVVPPSSDPNPSAENAEVIDGGYIDSPYSIEERERVGVSGSTHSDVTASVDALGFDVYIEAVASFLLSADTKPPLTLSVEGDWGSGKSTFMSLLGEQIRKIAKADGKPEPLIFLFDAWREESEESVWSAFVLKFARAIVATSSAPSSFLARTYAELRLAIARFNVSAATPSLTWAVVLWLVSVVMAAASTFFFFAQSNVALRIVLGITGLASVIAIVRSTFRGAVHVFAAPWDATLALARFVEVPDYRSRRGFGDTFAEDLPKIIRSYVRSGRRIFVFIDDIDRADPIQASAIMRGLSILMTTGQPQLIFVLGLDRRKVAAGIAMKNSAAIPYLFPAATAGSELNQAGLAYGFDFIEKFIQLPFVVPRPSRQRVAQYVASFTGDEKSEANDDGEAAARSERRRNLEVRLGAEEGRVKKLIVFVAPLFGNNPRKIKQFINIFRLQAFIASETGTLGEFGFEQLGIALALLLRFPGLSQKLEHWGDYFYFMQLVARGGRNKGTTHDKDRFDRQSSEVKPYLTQPYVETMLKQAYENEWGFAPDIDFTPLLLTNPRRPQRDVNPQRPDEKATARDAGTGNVDGSATDRPQMAHESATQSDQPLSYDWKPGNRPPPEL